MDNVRITEIAKELGMKNKEVVDKAISLGLDVKGHSSSISTEDAERLMNFILSGEDSSTIKTKVIDLDKDLQSIKVYPFNANKINSIEIVISNTKNIKKLSWKFPYSSGLYAIIGENGCGKSTLITCLAKLVQPSALKYEFIGKGFENSEVIYNLDEYSFKFEKKPNWNIVFDVNKSFEKLDGFFESSVLNGNRFKKIDSFFRNIEIEEGDVITDANAFIIKNMNYILTGSEIGKFNNLKKISARRKRRNSLEQFIDTPYTFYAIKTESIYIKEFFLSTGEYFLLSILKFLSSISKKEHSKPSIIIIDEIEISLHPLAQKRLIEKLIEFKDKFNLLIIFATHSLHIIEHMNPNDIYYLEKNSKGESIFSSPIYPAYLHSKLYNNTAFDKVILVEDELAKLFIKEIMSNFNINNMRYTILPIGGWEKVLEVHNIHNFQKIFGIAKVVSILDGDIQGKLSNEQKKVCHNFLPIKNVEYIVSSYLDENDKKFLAFINSKIMPHAFNELKLEIKTDTTQARKNTYNKLLYEVEKLKFSKDIFEQDIIKFIIKDFIYQEKISKFENFLKAFFDIN